MAKHVYIIAGEASGDNLGAALMRELKAQLGEVHFYGIGGEKMEAEGVESLFPYHQLSLMGFAEVVPHLFTLIGRINMVVEDIRLKQPDIVITIDSPGFNFRVVEKLRENPEKKKIRFLHYVAPSVWAYKPERAKKCAGLFDHMLVLLPFEPPYFEKEGLAATFVGHPVAFMKPGDGGKFREDRKIALSAPVMALLPGSREREIKKHMPIFAQTVTRLSAVFPELTLVVPVHGRFVPLVQFYFKDCPFRAIIVAEDQLKADAIASCNIALVKSGTVSLEVARAGVPQVVTYLANKLTAIALRRMVKIKYVNLINLSADREAIPELLQERCTSEFLASALEVRLRHPDLAERQRAASKAAFATMRSPDGREPHLIAAEVVLKLMNG